MNDTGYIYAKPRGEQIWLCVEAVMVEGSGAGGFVLPPTTTHKSHIKETKKRCIELGYVICDEESVDGFIVTILPDNWSRDKVLEGYYEALMFDAGLRGLIDDQHNS